MKRIKMFFMCLFAVAMIAVGVTVFNFNLNAQGDGLSDLALANIEALAQNEGGSSGSFTCYSTYSECWIFGCSKIYRCGNPCSDARADSWSDNGTCK
jgi:hypothetical protein